MDKTVFTDQVKGRIILLDLSSARLFGFESIVFGDKARRVLDRIERGEDIEAVPVVREEDDYFLTTLLARTGFKEGGHTRAYVHLKKGLPLKCLEVESRYKDPSRIPIQQLSLECME